MGLEAVGDLALHTILRKLGPQDSARAACVSKQLRASASEDPLWSHFCAHDLHLSHPLDPHGNLAPSFKACYQLWRESFSMYPWSLVKRVKRCWGRITNWLALHFPEAHSSLNKGASEADLQEFENLLKVKLPLPTRILYRFHNGQDIEDYSRYGNAALLGLIGGYSFYDHLVNVSLLPLHHIVVMEKLGFSATPEYVVVAASCTYREKLFFLNCTNGQLYVGTANLLPDGEMLPCVPNALVNSVHDHQQDAMLLWLEEHARRLENGIIKLCGEDTMRRISQFPEESPLCSTAVTSGVQINWSSGRFPKGGCNMGSPSRAKQSFLFVYLNFRNFCRTEYLEPECMPYGVGKLYESSFTRIWNRINWSTVERFMPELLEEGQAAEKSNFPCSVRKSFPLGFWSIDRLNWVLGLVIHVHDYLNVKKSKSKSQNNRRLADQEREGES